MSKRQLCGSINTQDGKPCQNAKATCPYPLHKQPARRSRQPAEIKITHDFQALLEPQRAREIISDFPYPGVCLGSPGLAGEPDLFEDLLLATQQRTGQNSVHIAKEYWLSSAIYATSADPSNCRIYSGKTGQLTGTTVFAGGSSLMSGWGIVDRHSEDIDLVVFGASDVISNSAAGRALKKALYPAYQYLAPVTGEPSKDPMRKLGYRNLFYRMPPDKEELYLKTEATFEGPTYGLPLHAERIIMSGMGKSASPETLEQYPELGGFKMLCVTPAYTAINKLDALHRRSLTGDLAGLIHRSRDLYDTAMIARTEHAAQVPELLDQLKHRVPRPFSTRRVVPRPDKGYASSPVFRQGTGAYNALKEGYESGLPFLVWGEMPSFKEAVELTLTLDP